MHQGKLILGRDRCTWFEWLCGVRHFHLSFDLGDGVLVHRRTAEQTPVLSEEKNAQGKSLIVHLATLTEQFLLVCEWNVWRRCHQCVGRSHLVGGGSSRGECRGDIYLCQQPASSGTIVLQLVWSTSAIDSPVDLVTQLVRDLGRGEGGSSLSPAALGWLG
jgi:hypothetical protein